MAASTGSLSRMQSIERLDLSHLHSMPQLLTALHHNLRMISTPLSYDQLQKNENIASKVLGPVTRQLQQNDFPGVIWALLWTSFEFSQAAHGEESNVDSTRSLAAQLIAVRILRTMSSQDVIRALTLDFDLPASPNAETTSAEPSDTARESIARETQSLLTGGEEDTEAGRGTSRQIATMSALEIAIVAQALKFIAAPIVRGVIEDIWKGNVVLWGDLDINASTARKKPTIYAWRRTMWAGYARLRVPRAFDTIPCDSCPIRPRSHLRSRNLSGYMVSRICLWGTRSDTGLESFIVFTGSLELFRYCNVGWLVARVLGLAIEGNWTTTDFAFDVLSLEALFLVPRAFSFLGLWQYYGQLLPTLKELVKDFLKFLVIIAILYCGFFVTFWSLGQDTFTISQLAWFLVRIFFGSSYIGFDSMHKFGLFGPTLMIIFVCLTQIVLITVLISILSNQFAKYNARDQYHFLFAYACVESISSDHTFDFYPPTNLLQLLLLRPLRLFLPSRHPFLQRLKFTLFRITHAPFVIGVTLFEQIFCTKNVTKRMTTGMLRPPSSRSGRFAANRVSFYSQTPVKFDGEHHHMLEEARGYELTDIGDIDNRLKKLEDEISSIKDMLQEVIGRL